VKWLGMAACLVSIPILLGVQWIYFPVTPGMNAFQFPLFGFNLPCAVSFASFGTLAAAALLLCAAACWFEAPLWGCIAGGLLLAVCEVAYLRIVNGSYGILARLAREAVWLHRAYVFDTIYLPRNAAAEPSLWKQFSFDTVADRLLNGWYFMGVGWVATLAVALAITLTAMKLLGGRRARTGLALTVAALVTIAGLMLHGPLAAQRAIVAAMRADARGDTSSAIAEYRRAMRLDDWFGSTLGLPMRIGQIEAGLGDHRSVEARIFRAETIVGLNQMPGTVGELPAAIQLYREIAAQDGPQRTAAAARGSDIAADFGANLLFDGAFGSAIVEWQAALRIERGNWLARYYLSRGYYVAARYKEAAEATEVALKLTGDPRLLGDLYSNLGDALTRQGKLDDGHLAYAKAYKLDFMSNFRGIDSLVGPQE
jgi:hypothetical protein